MNELEPICPDNTPAWLALMMDEEETAESYQASAVAEHQSMNANWQE